jgi:mRNA interferase HigB
MQLVGRDVLINAGKRNAPLRRWLSGWIAAVEKAAWQSLDDVRDNFPAADGVKLLSQTVVTVFNVKGNDHRLLALIDYSDQRVEVLEVLTYAEYDKHRWKARYCDVHDQNS